MFTNLFLTRFLPLLETEGNGGTGGTGSTGSTTPPDGGTEPQTATPPSEPPKTFTQEDLNRIAAQEKRQGTASILKALGFEKEEDAKAFIEKYRKQEDEKKDDLTKATETLTATQKAKEEAERKAELLERKFKTVAAGVPADKADDIVILASAKITDGKTFDDALEEVKKTYPTFFEGTTTGTGSSSGTGTGGNPPRGKGGSGGKESLGKRLAEQKKTSAQQKKSYFSN